MIKTLERNSKVPLKAIRSMNIGTALEDVMEINTYKIFDKPVWTCAFMGEH